MPKELFCCNFMDCNKSYPTKYNLRRHISVVHLRVRNYPCSYCDKRFTSRQNVRDHELIHSGSKPFQCFTCGKAFRQVSQMRVHEMTHVDKKQEETLIEEIKDKCDAQMSENVISLPPISEERMFRQISLPPLPEVGGK